MLRIALAVSLAIGCSKADRPDRAAAPLAPRVATPAAPPTAPVVAAPAAWSAVGWWRSDGLCFELFANGDFHLTLMGAAPKAQILGTAKLPGGDRAELTVTRIWQARFTGPCRRTHQLGQWIDSKDALGITFKPGATLPLTLARLDDDHVELCGKTCAKLARETPALTGRWRRAGMESPPWTTGDLLELKLGATSSHLWIGAADGEHDTIRGQATARYVGADRFSITLTTGERSLELTARRLPGERLELCADRCSTLERQFDAYHHDVH